MYPLFRTMQGGRDATPPAGTLAATTPPPALVATSAVVGMSAEQLGAASPPLFTASPTGTLSLLQAADALSRLDAAPTVHALLGPAPFLVVDALMVTGVDAASSAPVLDGDSARVTLPDVV